MPVVTRYPTSVAIARPVCLSDEFNGTAGTLLSAHTPDLYLCPTPPAWTLRAGNPGQLKLDGSGRILPNTSGNDAIYGITDGIFGPDVAMEADFQFVNPPTSPATDVELILRYHTATLDWYGFIWEAASGGQWRLYKFSNGVLSTLGTWADSPTGGVIRHIRAEALGSPTQLKLFVDGTLRINPANDNDARLVGGTVAVRNIGSNNPANTAWINNVVVTPIADPFPAWSGLTPTALSADDANYVSRLTAGADPDAAAAEALFGLDSVIPVSSTINNVKLEQQVRVGSSSPGRIDQLGVQAVVGGVGQAIHSPAATLPTVDTNYSYDVTAERSWTRADLLDANFKVRMLQHRAVGGATSETGFWDYVRTVVDYTVADTTGPTLAITSPVDGASVTGIITLTATASDPSGVANVQWKVDGVNFHSPDATSPYTDTLDTNTLSVGSHSITAVATDNVGNPSTATVNISVYRTAPAHPVRIKISSGWIDLTTNTYIFTQTSPSTTWSIVHNLGRNPSVTVIDSGGTEIITDVQYVDANNLQITFGAPTSGKAYLN